MQLRPLFLTLLVLMLLLTASCAPKLIKKEQFITESPKPYKRITDYSDALKKLGAMIDAYGVIEQDVLVIQAKPVTNRSACKNLPMDITDMIESAVNKIGGKVRCALYHPSYIQGELITGSKTIGRQLPELVIDGAITECDENLDTQSHGVDADLMLDGDPKADIGGGYNKSLTYSNLALDLHFMDYATQILIPNKQTSIAVEVWNLQKNYNFGFQINGSGLGFDGQRKVVQGKHDAIRILVELSVLQLIGKYLELPYWRCLKGADEDADVIGLLNKQFSQAPPEKRVSVIQTLLLRHGYRLSASGQLDPATVNAINEVAARSGDQAPAKISPRLYSYLYTQMPLTVSAVPNSITPAPQVFSQQQTAPMAQIDPDAINLHTVFVFAPEGQQDFRPFHPGDLLRSGDHYKILVKPEDDTFLYLFQMDSSQQLYWLFPMDDLKINIQSRQPLKKNKTYSLPAQDEAYFLDQMQGNENIYMIARKTPDPYLEELGRLLMDQTDPQARRDAENKILQYIAAKKQVRNVNPGNQLTLNGIITLDASKLTGMDKDHVYIFPFRHR